MELLREVKMRNSTYNSNSRSKMISRRRGLRQRRHTPGMLRSRRRANEDRALIWNWNTAGFSLVELLAVITILGVLCAIVGFQYNNWTIKNNVEAQVKQMATDINELRVRALTTKQRHTIELYDNRYIMKSYSSETFTSNAELLANGTTFRGTREVKFRLKSTIGSGTFFTGNAVEINERGMLANVPVTIFLATGASTSSAAVNCLTIHTVRVNVGKQNDVSGDCDDK